MKTFEDFMNEVSVDYVAIIDATKPVMVKGEKGYRVMEVVKGKSESLKIMNKYIDGDEKKLMGGKRKIHRTVVDLSVAEEDMRGTEIFAIPTSGNKDNPKYRIVFGDKRKSGPES